jgi:hypothetical protein
MYKRMLILLLLRFTSFFFQGSSEANKEVGRSLATMLVDEVFHEVVYRSKNRENLLAGVDEFIDNVTALPPGEWDPDILLEPPSNVPSQVNLFLRQPHRFKNYKIVIFLFP